MPAQRRGAWSPEDIRGAMRLYAVTDDAWLDGRTLTACVREALEGGATCVQLRQKGAPSASVALAARALAPACREFGVPLLVDDDVEATRAAGVDGVHVGQSDAACAEARAALGEDAIIGVSVQTVEQARAAEAAGADYLGVGAVVDTSTKPEAWVVSPEEFRAIAAAVDIPVVAIGGLNAATVPLLADYDVDGAAVVSAIFAAGDIAGATRELSRIIGETLG